MAMSRLVPEIMSSRAGPSPSPSWMHHNWMQQDAPGCTRMHHNWMHHNWMHHHHHHHGCTITAATMAT
eukprot:1159199-Pelagomonas_calceolata.AAC.3